MFFYDAHLHNKSLEAGGFVIGLETGYYDDTLSNEQVLLLHSIEKKYIGFYYVAKREIKQLITHKYLKYHARLEKYSPDEVMDSIYLNQPRAVIIDTLNEPDWVPYDYWKIVRRFPKIPFILAHAGGYAVNEFIKIGNIQKNVWLDFSLTHSVLGKYGAQNGLDYIHQAIRFGLNHNFKDRILFGSDFPFYSQNQIFDYYRNKIDMLNSNFETLVELIK